MRIKRIPINTEHGELVGHCGVDSGQIMLTDPCYVKDFKDEMNEGGTFKADLPKPYPYTYNGASSATCSDDMVGQLGHSMGVCVSSGYGDGVYPVYVTYNSDGRVATATIVFIAEDEDEDEDENNE